MQGEMERKEFINMSIHDYSLGLPLFRMVILTLFMIHSFPLCNRVEVSRVSVVLHVNMFQSSLGHLFIL